ncbi:hypothetical protein [Frigoribacterium sp. PvP032]|uniref:hypothetical protein n=1 Tax=Frigoribacterium sp. PvP032 TaxID=2806589 RepID=UPI001AE5AEBC|nr:hypothetical protein [Frigoribacterium sp. PvP032]MBP1189461.1 hypothetical protein [Frigoribacterium sp. PvP032]
MAPTRERPGIVRVRISDREVWHVADPALTEAEAEEAVRAHRAANAPTNRSVVRRVLAWSPGAVALLLLVGAVVGTVAIMSELDLAELPARFAVAVVLSVVGLVVVAVVGIVLVEAPWRRGEADVGGPGPATSRSVVPIEGAALDWASDATSPADLWRVLDALSLLAELDGAQWRLVDVLYGRLDEWDEWDGGDGSGVAARGPHPAQAALRAAQDRASAELIALGREVGLPAMALIRPVTDRS